MYYTTKTVPNFYSLDNEGVSVFRGWGKVCGIARFACEFAHFARGKC